VRFVVRLLGAILVAAGLAVAAVDLSAGVGPLATSAGELWYRIDPGSLNLTQAVIQRYVHPGLYDPVLLTVLLWPAALVLGVPGAVLLLLTGRR
jgi:hypothetical protein